MYNIHPLEFVKTSSSFKTVLFVLKEHASSVYCKVCVHMYVKYISFVLLITDISVFLFPDSCFVEECIKIPNYNCGFSIFPASLFAA